MEQTPSWVGPVANLIGAGALTFYLVKIAIPQMRKDWRDSAVACREERAEQLKAFREECAAQREHDKIVVELLRDEIRASAR